MSFKYYFVKYLNIISVVFLLIIIFIYQRNTLSAEETLIHAFRTTYNERIFLALYVTVYLVSLFPLLKLVFQTEYVVRISTKWRFFEMLCKKIFFIAFLYSLLLSFGWYAIVGSGIQDFITKRYVLYIICIFLGQLIGWIEIGMIEVYLYILIQNLPLSFIISDALLIGMNLSLYISHNEHVLQYTRLYDFMFYPEEIGDLYKIVSNGFFHIAILSLLFLTSYEFIKRHDYIMGGKREHANS